MHSLKACVLTVFVLFGICQCTPNYYLSVATIFCKESHIFIEWLDHYWSEGVRKFYMIDNCNTTLDQKILEPYVKSGIVRLIINTKKHYQDRMYNEEILELAKNETEYLIMADMDEFYYSPAYNTLADSIIYFKSCVGIQVPWILYGTNNNTQTPPSIIHSNLKRWNWHLSDKDIGVLGKYIVKVGEARGLGTHSFDHKYRTRPCLAIKERVLTIWSRRMNVSEAYIPNYIIRINHYLLQSKMFYQNVKMKRGDVNGKQYEKLRTAKYFMSHDRNEMEDFDLSNRRMNFTINAPKYIWKDIKNCTFGTLINYTC